MFEKGFTIPEIILIAGTRVALGAGIGLLIGGKLSRDAAKGAGVEKVGIVTANMRRAAGAKTN